jgi:hypothetical protein
MRDHQLVRAATLVPAAPHATLKDGALAADAVQGFKDLEKGRTDSSTASALHQGRVMSSAERTELGKLLRLRGTVAKSDAKERGAEQLAIVEQQLAAKYLEDDPIWRELTAEGEAAIRAINAKLAAKCDARGIPATFRPGLSVYWSARGENAARERRTELRTVAQRVVEANVKRACVEVDRAVAGLQTQLLSGAILSTDGRTFLDALPPIEALLPAPTLESIERIAQR